MDVAMLCLAAGCGWLAGYGMRRMLRWLLPTVRVSGPWCEAITATLWVIAVARAFGDWLPWWWLPVPLALGWCGVALAVADLRALRLPDVLTVAAYPVFAALIAVAAYCGDVDGLALRALLGTVVFGGAHLLVRLAVPSGLGAGDVKLAGSLGAVLGAVGWPAIAVAAVLAAVITVLLASAARLARRAAWRGGIPHGPGLLAAAWLVAAFPGATLVGAS